MKFKDFPSWLKGGVIGGVIGLIFIFFGLIIEGVKINRLLETLFGGFLIFVIPSILLGMFVGFLSGLIKNKFVFVGGIIGVGMMMFVSVLASEVSSLSFLIWIAWPVISLMKLTLGGQYDLRFVANTFGDTVAVIIFPLIIISNILLWSLAGFIFGFLVNLIKKKSGEKNDR